MTQIRYPLFISGTGLALPTRVVTSTELELARGWPAGWCQMHTGVKQRYWAQPGEDISRMGAQALKGALLDAGIPYDALDLVICGSATYDHPVPHNSCLIQQQMGSQPKPVPGWDIDATCLGFITALDVASRLLDGRRYQHIAIVCSEICSTSLNPEDAETYALMGDGAVAFVVSYFQDRPQGVLAGLMQTWPEYASLTLVPAGGNRMHALTHPEEKDYYFRMEGSKLLKTALRHLKPFTQQLLQSSGLSISDIDCIIPHQASLNGIHGFARLMGLGLEKMYINIGQFGNTLSASVGIALHEALVQQVILPGQKVLLIGTGAGFSIGGLVMEF